MHFYLLTLTVYSWLEQTKELPQHSADENHWWSAMTDTYPPFTPMNCRFFFVEGDPGSPSAFRFIMDLREDCGEEAKRDTGGHTYSSNMMWLEQVRMMVEGCFVQCSYLFWDLLVTRQPL